MGNPETVIKNKGLKALDKFFFRGRFANNPVGDAVPVSAVKAMRARFHYLPEVVEAIDQLPRIKYSVPGSSDVWGIVPVTITSSMVGNSVGVVTCVEFKTDTGRQSDQQKIFERVINAASGVYVVERDHVGIGERVLAAVMARLTGVSK